MYHVLSFVRACDEIQGQLVFKCHGKRTTQIIKGADQSFFDSECVSCGACARLVPPRQFQMYFSPKHLWVKIKLERCAHTVVLDAIWGKCKNNEILSIPSAFRCREVNNGHTCLKGRFAFKFLWGIERLRYPMIRKDGELQRSAGMKPLDYIANRLNEIKNTYGPESIGAFPLHDVPMKKITWCRNSSAQSSARIILTDVQSLSFTHCLGIREHLELAQRPTSLRISSIPMLLWSSEPIRQMGILLLRQAAAILRWRETDHCHWSQKNRN